MKTHCIRGHALTPATVYEQWVKYPMLMGRPPYVKRVCKECQRAHAAAWWRKKRAVGQTA